jgi:4-deoxy-L-threo-5-hexosulose-uronate ketol-isomerase
MDIRYAMHPDQMRGLDTGEIRRHFLIDRLFEKDEMNLVYSHIDRIIVGGLPCRQRIGSLKDKGVRVDLSIEELGIINIGSKGIVCIDGKEYILEKKECLYVGMGSKEVSFKSPDRNNPAKFYLNSTPAHSTYPTVKLSINDAQSLHLGVPEKANVRTIYQFIHPKVLSSCQLVMG